MFKNLRIIFCIIAVLLTAACIFVFVYAGWAWGFIVAAAAVVCYFLMVLFKKKQEEQEGTANPAEPEGDFITGRVTADSAAERYTAYNSAITVEQSDGTQRTFILTKGDKDTFDKVGTKTPLGRVIWHKQIGDEVTYKDGDLKDVTLKIINIE